MARNSNRGQYDRPSWREIDAKRGKKRDPAAAKPAKEPDRWQQKQRDEKFDLLFSDPNKELARKKIVECLGKDTFI
ncbi:MAG TPA: hypothetical protein VMV18_03030, partial [bacterium]|nr:hypothetical protein [bacterium]